MRNNRNKVQFLLNEYLEMHGKIDLQLPDRVDLEIGITQETKRGTERQGDYCWVSASRDDRSMMLDRYALSASFENGTVLEQDQEVTII